MAETVASIKGVIELQDRGWKRGITDAAKDTRTFSSEADRATASCAAFMAAEIKAAGEVRRTGEALRQENAFLKEMAGLESRMTSIREGSNRTLQQAAQRYSDLSRAEQLEVAAARSAVIAHEAQQKAIADAATAAERAAAREIAATERAAAAAERAAQRRLSASRIGQGLASAGRALSLGVTAPILGLAAGGVKLFGDMEENLNVLQQISGATNDQMKRLGDQAIALGGDMKLPATSAADAARAMIELKQAGLSVDEVMKAARPTLVLTAATGLDVAESARLAASTMNAFALPPARLTHIMDMLVAAQSAAGVKMREITPAIRQASAAFRTAGQSPESLITALAVLSKAGVRGELAGTGLRNMLVNLAKETPKVTAAMKALGVQAFDPITKQMKPLRTLIDEMSRALERFTPQARSNILNSIFGGRAQGVSVLFRGVEQFDQMAVAIEKEGAAAAAAEARNKGLKGAMDALRSAMETALIQGITPIKDDLNVFARRIGEVAKAFADLPAPVRKNIVEMLALSAAIGPALILLGNLTKGFGLVKGALEAMTAETFLAKAAIGGPWIAAAVVSAGLLYAAWDKPFMVNARKGIEKFAEDLSSLVERAKGNYAQLASLAADAQSKIGLDRPGPSLTGFPNRAAERSQRIADRVAALGPNALDTKLFGGSLMDEAAARARRVISHQAAPTVVGMPTPAPAARGTLAAPGPKTFDASKAGKMTPLEKEQARYAEEWTQAQARLNEVLTGGGTIAQQVAARYHLLTQTQRDNLTHTLERIKKGQDELKLSEAIKDARARLAQILAGEGNIAADVAAKYHGLSAARQKELVTLLEQGKAADAVEKAHMQALRSKTVRAQGGELNNQVVALDLYGKKWEELDKAQAQAVVTVLKYKSSAKLDDQQTQKVAGLKDRLLDLSLQYEALTAKTEIQRFAARELHTHWGTLDDDGKTLAAQIFQMTSNVKGLTDAQQLQKTVLNNQMDAWFNLNDAYDKAVLQHRELSGATKLEQESFKALTQDLNLADSAVLDLIQDYLLLMDANEKLAKLNAHNAQVLERQDRAYGDLLGTFSDLNTQYALMTGKLSDADVFWEQITQGLDLTDEAATNLALSVYDLYKQTQKMSESRKFMEQFAQGTQNVFEGMFHHLMEHGFKGFFRSVVDGFKQLFQQIAAQYLASQLTELIFGKQNQGGGRTGGILGGLLGGGGGGGLSGGGGIMDLIPKIFSGAPTEGGPDVPIYAGGTGGISPLLTTAAASRRQPVLAAAGTGGGNVTINMTVHAKDADSFRRNEGQIMSSLHRAGELQRRRNGTG